MGDFRYIHTINLCYAFAFKYIQCHMYGMVCVYVFICMCVCMYCNLYVCMYGMWLGCTHSSNFSAASFMFNSFCI